MPKYKCHRYWHTLLKNPQDIHNPMCHHIHSLKCITLCYNSKKCHLPCRIHDWIKVRLYCWNLSRPASFSWKCQWQNIIWHMKNDKKDSRPIVITYLQQGQFFIFFSESVLKLLSVINGYSKYLINNTEIFLNSKRLILAALILLLKDSDELAFYVYISLNQ